MRQKSKNRPVLAEASCSTWQKLKRARMEPHSQEEQGKRKNLQGRQPMGQSRSLRKKRSVDWGWRPFGKARPAIHRHRHRHRHRHTHTDTHTHTHKHRVTSFTGHASVSLLQFLTICVSGFWKHKEIIMTSDQLLVFENTHSVYYSH